jgi:hypothetical protein
MRGNLSGGGGVGFGAEAYDRKNAWSSTKSFNPLWLSPRAWTVDTPLGDTVTRTQPQKQGHPWHPRQRNYKKISQNNTNMSTWVYLAEEIWQIYIFLSLLSDLFLRLSRKIRNIFVIFVSNSPRNSNLKTQNNDSLCNQTETTRFMSKRNREF